MQGEVKRELNLLVEKNVDPDPQFNDVGRLGSWEPQGQCDGLGYTLDTVSPQP